MTQEEGEQAENNFCLEEGIGFSSSSKIFITPKLKNPLWITWGPCELIY
jgi:hypothetical protein